MSRRFAAALAAAAATAAFAAVPAAAQARAATTCGTAGNKCEYLYTGGDKSELQKVGGSKPAIHVPANKFPSGTGGDDTPAGTIEPDTSWTLNAPTLHNAWLQPNGTTGKCATDPAECLNLTLVYAQGNPYEADQGDVLGVTWPCLQFNKYPAAGGIVTNYYFMLNTADDRWVPIKSADFIADCS